MDRRAFVATMAGALLTARRGAGAQAAERVYRVGILGLHPPPRISPQMAAYFAALRAGLREHGYVEGRNLVIEFRWIEGNFERGPGLAAELARLPVDVFVAASTRSAMAARAANRQVPIVFIGITDPVSSGLVASLARPGGNATGVTWDVTPDTSAKLLELLKDAVPQVSRVAALWESSHPVAASLVEATRRAARLAGVTVHPLDVRSADQYAPAFDTILRERVEGLVILPSLTTWNYPKPLLDFAAQHRLPSAYHSREFVDQGGLMSYGPNFPAMTRRAATYIAKIFRGAKPADLPAEQPTTFELVINLRTAKALGLTIPPAVLARADEVIE